MWNHDHARSRAVSTNEGVAQGQHSSANFADTVSCMLWRCTGDGSPYGVGTNLGRKASKFETACCRGEKGSTQHTVKSNEQVILSSRLPGQQDDHYHSKPVWQEQYQLLLLQSQDLLQQNLHAD